MTVEMIVYRLLKIFVGLIILLVYLRLTHRSQAGHQPRLTPLVIFVIGWCVRWRGCTASRLACFYFVILHGVYAVHD